MKKFLQGAVLPFVIFSSGILLLGCNQAMQEQQQSEQRADATSNHDDMDSSQQDETKPTTESHSNLKQGNMFYIARDVADVQFKTGDYLEKLQQSQADLQQAIEAKNPQQLQETAKNLSRELQGFNTALISLDLKTQEIDSLRQQVLSANKQVLNSPLLNGEVDISKVDFNKIEKQMNTIQTDMVKLAGMVLLSAGSESDSQKSNDSSSDHS